MARPGRHLVVASRLVGSHWVLWCRCFWRGGFCWCWVRCLLPSVLSASLAAHYKVHSEEEQQRQRNVAQDEQRSWGEEQQSSARRGVAVRSEEDQQHEERRLSSTRSVIAASAVIRCTCTCSWYMYYSLYYRSHPYYVLCTVLLT